MNAPTHRVAVNVASLYKDADSSSEQTSQVIWGSAQFLLGEDGEFAQVQGEDLYVGWVRTSALVLLVDDSDVGISTVAPIFAEVYSEPTAPSELVTRLTAGARVVLSRLPATGNFIPIDLPHGGIGHIHKSQLTLAYSTSTDVTIEQSSAKAQWICAWILDRVAESAPHFIGIPYLWGGTTPFGLDCSGFVQLVFKLNGLQLMRDASQQYRDRRFAAVNSTQGLTGSHFVRSDLLFFGSEENGNTRVTHVGIALGNGRFIHSVGKGRGNIITSCSSPEFSATFVGARRLVPNEDLSIDRA